jgi:hypothetical protein
MKNAQSQTCRWKEGWEGNWHSECEEVFYFADGTPHENKCIFCPFCGGDLIEIKYLEKQES